MRASQSLVCASEGYLREATTPPWLAPRGSVENCDEPGAQTSAKRNAIAQTAMTATNAEDNGRWFRSSTEASDCERRRQEGSGTPEHGAIAGRLRSLANRKEERQWLYSPILLMLSQTFSRLSTPIGRAVGWMRSQRRWRLSAAQRVSQRRTTQSQEGNDHGRKAGIERARKEGAGGEGGEHHPRPLLHPVR